MSTERSGLADADAMQVDAAADVELVRDDVDPRPGPAHRRDPWRRLVALGLAAAAVLLAAWSGHAAGAVQGREAGAREALAATRVLVWFTGTGEPDGAGRARIELFAATGSGQPITLRQVHVGADSVTPVHALAVPAVTSASGTAVAEVRCGSARELELMRSAPDADRVGTVVADVLDADGVRRELPAAPLPDATAVRALLHVSACPSPSGDGIAATPPSGVSVVAMTTQENGDLRLFLEESPEGVPADVSVVPLADQGPFVVTAQPARGIRLRPGGPRGLLVVRIATRGCVDPFGGQPSVEGLFTLEVRTPGLVSQTRLPGWDQGAVGQASAVALSRGCEHAS